ncbi:MAG TPA: hypothetical protein VGB67_02405 [Fibrella sp.]
MSFLEKLLEWQEQIGYQSGEINLIALMGLMGESGEVLNEVDCELSQFLSTDAHQTLSKMGAHFNYSITAAGLVDTQKKILRSMEWRQMLTVTVKGDGTDFNKELADAFYYLLILATGRKLTIEDLAKLSYEKVVAKNTQMKMR